MSVNLTQKGVGGARLFWIMRQPLLRCPTRAPPGGATCWAGQTTDGSPKGRQHVAVIGDHARGAFPEPVVNGNVTYFCPALGRNSCSPPIL